MLVLAVCLGGCRAQAPPGPRTVAFERERYEHVFQSTKDELRRLGFVLDRIDGREGVITTRPKESTGLASPWEMDESSLRQELENYLQRQRRRVEATFVPADAAAGLVDDVDDPAAMIELRVRVVVERVYRFGLQVDPQSVRLASVWRDPVLEDLGAQPSFATRFEEDDWLAARIAARVGRDLGRTQ
jgi:hypothetical protein